MNNNEGAINFTIGLDNSQLQADAAKATAQLRGIGNTASAEGARMGNAFTAASGYITMAAMAGVASIGVLGKTILDTTAKFEKFGIVLKNTLGDVKGSEALSMIANFAATTPFQLDEVTGAFIKLANQGFVPTYAEMTKLGDLASSTGKSFDQLGEALLDAQTGQFERLKEFGIKASANGDRVTFSFKEQQTTVENTNSSIQKYILSLGELKGVAGANAKISESLTGQISNLSDKLAAMYNEIGTSNKGLLYSVVGGASTLIENYKAIGDVITGLIGIYGAYKVAVMVIAYQDGLAIAAKARNLAIETAMEAELASVRAVSASSAAAMALNAVAMSELRAAATVKVIAAEEALAATQKASSLANPYVLAAMAVAALGYAIYKVVTYQTDLEKSTQKLNVEIANEKDKAAQLFAELGNAAKETDEWKKAKEAILSQYGTYLTEQQKELSNTKLIGEAYASVNGEIEKTISLRIRNEALAAVSAEFNPKIKEAQQDLTGLTKGSLSREAAAKYNGRASVLVELIKYTTDPEAKAKAVAEYHKINEELIKATINDGTVAFAISKQLGIINKGLTDYKQGMDDVNAAFKEPAGGPVTPPPPPDTKLTTYQAQRKELQKEKAKLEKELRALMVTPGEDPTKAITAKQGQIDALNKQLGITAAEAKKASKETVDREKEVVEAMKTATGEKLALLAKELTAIEKVKKSREDLISAAMFDAKYGDINQGDAGMSGVILIGAKGKAVAKKTTAVSSKDNPLVLEDTSKTIESNNKRIKEIDEEEKDRLEEQIRLREDIVSYALQLVDALRDTMDLTEAESQALNGVMNVVSSLSHGDYIGAAISFMTTGIQSIMDTSGIEKSLTAPWIAFEDWVSRSNAVLERYIKLRDESIGSDRYTTSDAAIKAAQDNRIEAQNKINDLKTSWTIKETGLFSDNAKKVMDRAQSLIKSIGEGALHTESMTGVPNLNSKGIFSYALNQLTTDKDGNFSLTKIQKLIDDGIIADAAVINAVKEYNTNLAQLTKLEKDKQELLTNTMASSISDSIIDGFKNGYSAAADFASTFEDLMKNALLNSLKIETEPKIKAWYEHFTAAMKGGVLSDKEKQDLKAEWDGIIANESASKKAMYATAGITDISTGANGNSLSGKISGAITEDTANELMGATNRISLDIRETLNLSKTSSNHLLNIAANTLRTADNTEQLSRMENVEKSLKSIDTAVNKTASRI